MHELGLAFLLHGISWKLQQFPLLRLYEGGTATARVGDAPGGFTRQQGSARGTPGTVPVWRDVLWGSSAAPAPLAKAGQDAVQGSTNRGIQRKGSTLFAAESGLLCCSTASVNTSIKPQAHECILHTTLHQSYFH